jgi:hypothetical protein
MRSPGVLLIISVIGALALEGQAGAEGFPLQEYDTFVSRYVGWLENLAVDIIVKSGATDGSATSEVEASAVSIPGHFRTKIAWTQKHKNGRENKTTTWELLQPDGYYKIDENAAGKFLLKEMRKNISSPLLVEYQSSPIDWLLRPVNLNAEPINKLIRAGQLYDLTFERRLTMALRGKKGKAEVQFEFNEHWLVTALKLEVREKAFRRKTDITYTNLGDRVLPARITTHIEGAGVLPGPPSVIEFHNYRHYNGSHADFSLSQFGLPEPVGSSSAYQGGSRWYVWFIAVAAAALLVGAYFWRRVKKRKAAMMQNPAN